MTLTDEERRTLELIDWHAYAAATLLQFRQTDESIRAILRAARAGTRPAAGTLPRKAGRYRVRGRSYAVWFGGFVLRGYVLPDTTIDGVDGDVLRRFAEDNPASVGRTHLSTVARLHLTIPGLLSRGALTSLVHEGPEQLVHRPALAGWRGDEWRSSR